MSQNTFLHGEITKRGTINLVSVAHALRVAEHLSFRSAAKALGIRHGALIRRVRALERRLGVTLFEGHPGGVRITNAGDDFFRHAREALDQLDEATRAAGAAGRGETGRLSVGIRSSIATGFLRELLRTCWRRHPDVAIRFDEGSSTKHISLVRSRQLDVAFVADAGAPSECEAIPLWSERLFVALPQNHPLSRRKAIDWLALAAEHFVFRQSTWGAALCDRVTRRLSVGSRSPNIERVGVGRETVMHLVAMGRGVTLTSEATTVTWFPGVIFRPITGGDEMVQFSAVWAPGNVNPALWGFLSLARDLAQDRVRHQDHARPERPLRLNLPVPQLVSRFSRRAFKKARSVDMNRASMAGISFTTSTDFPVSRASTSA